jgi:hypothetical protein
VSRDEPARRLLLGPKMLMSSACVTTHPECPLGRHNAKREQPLARAGRFLAAMPLCSSGGATFGAVRVLLRGELVALTLPRVRERGKRRSRLVGIR